MPSRPASTIGPANRAQPGARLMLRPCAPAPAQRWAITLTLHPRVAAISLSVASAKGEMPARRAGLLSTVAVMSPGAVRRQQQASVARSRTRRAWARQRRRGRTGMAADVAEQLAAFGTDFDGEIAGQTAKIYASQPGVYEAAKSRSRRTCLRPARGQQVDVHTATVRRSERPCPWSSCFMAPHRRQPRGDGERRRLLRRAWDTWG